MKASTLTLREMTEADIPQVTDVIRAAFAEYRDRLDPPSSAEHKTPQIVRRELADGGAFVVCDGHTVAGCVFYHVRPDHMYLDRLAVLPGYRAQGIARKLIRAVELRAHEHDLGEVRLSVRLALERQRAYYERMGYCFLSEGTHRGHEKPTFVMLQKRIG